MPGTCIFEMKMKKSVNPIFFQEILDVLKKLRGQGLYRASVLTFEAENQIRLYPASRSGHEKTHLVIIQVEKISGKSWYFQPPYERHRFYRENFPDTSAWIQAAAHISNGEKPFLLTNPDQCFYK